MASNLAQARIDLESEFQTSIVETETPNLSVQWDNTSDTRTKDDMSCRLKIDFVRAEAASVGDPGNNRQRVAGVMVAELYYPADKGTKELHRLADKILGNFRQGTVGVVDVLDGYPRLVGAEGGLFQMNVILEFFVDSFD